MEPNDYSYTIQKACGRIALGDVEGAAGIIRDEYPFSPLIKTGRSYTPRTMTRIFVRDGFIDRYRGTRLVFPPTLRILSHYLPSELPYHKNGKMSEGHLAYWELFPTIDHVVPVSRGGVDSEENWVCCSMLTNGIKANWTLDQLQWELLPPGDMKEWDGMLDWFLQHVERNSALLQMPYLKTWYYAALSIINSR